MATYANLTVNAKDILGDNFDPSRASVWIEANTPHSLIVVDGSTVRVGGRREKPDSDGTVVFEDLVTTNSADNPTSFGYRVTILYVPKGSRRQGHDTFTTSDFPFTASANLAAIDAAWDDVAIPQSWRSDFMDAAQAQLDVAMAAVDADRAFIEARVVDDLGTTDGQTKALVETPTSLTAQAILATIEAARTDKGDGLVAALDQKRTAVLAVLSDSTALATHGQWPYKLGAGLIASYPQTLIRHRFYDSGTSTYAAPTTIHSGAGVVTAFSDNFNRTTPELVGSVPQLGGAWDGTTGKWSANGSAAVSTTSGNTIRAAMTHAGEQSMDLSFSMVTNAGAFDTFIHYVDASNFLILEVNPASTGNVYLKTAYGGTTTIIDTATFAEAGITDGSASLQSITVTDFKLSGTTVSATVGSTTLSATITSGQRDTYLTGAIAGCFSPGAVSVQLDNMSVEVNASAAATFDIYNGSVGSTKVDYPRSRILAMIPVQPDVVYLSYSHNHTTETPATFEAEVDTTIAAIRNVYPDVPIVIGGQNPQYAPTANPAQHNAREADLRRYARMNGYGYAPVFEGFMAQSNPQAGVKSDGVHPNETGAQWWADSVGDYLAALSMKPTA